MGNLRQEHGFKTSDAGAAGLGIAQWIGGRRAALEAKANPYDLHTQLTFMIEELQSTESVAGAAIRSAQSVEDAVVAFERKFERCNPTYCMTQQRIGYAMEILERYQDGKN